MAKYFLGSVGKAEAFRVGQNGELELAFVSKTLTDSGLNISITKDDIRGGQGAPIQFSFYHDPSVEITLTDIQFKTEYITAQLGAEFGLEGAESFITKEYQLSSTAATLEKPIKPMGIQCGNGEKLFAWAAPQGSDEWFMLVVSDNGGKVALPAGKADGKYCVRYLADDSRANVARITSQIIPEELYLVITAPIFAGDACAASRGKAAGEIQFEVARFLLNGGQEFSMNMSSNQTMSLSGIALASTSSECEGNGDELLKIREVIYDRKWYDSVTSLVADPENLKVGDEPKFFGINGRGEVLAADNGDLLFPEGKLDAQGKWAAAGAVEVSIKEKPSIKCNVTITQA